MIRKRNKPTSWPAMSTEAWRLILLEQKMVSNSYCKVVGSSVERSVRVHKPRHVPHELKGQFSERQGREKKSRIKKISFSVLVYEFHEKGYFLFHLKLLDSTESWRSWCAGVMSPKYCNLQSRMRLWTVSVGFSLSHINTYSVNAYLWASHLTFS